MSISRGIMRAIRVAAFGGPEALKLETNVPIPSPGNKEVLIKVAAAGVNPVDTYVRAGAYAILPTLPYTPGVDAAGVVEEVGSEVKGFKKGDRVFALRSVSGTCAEYMTAEAQFVGHLCERLSFQQGAAIGVPYYTAVKALHVRAQARPGESVFIHGASGAVGIAAIQVSKAMGLRVAGTAGTKEGLDLIKRIGADFVFNHREEDYIKLAQETFGAPDIILEMLANVNLEKDLQMVNSRGKVMVIGCRGSIEINPRLTMGKESSIMGVILMNSSEAEWREMHSLLAAGQLCGWLEPKVSKVYPLADVGIAHHDVIHNQGTTGKLVIDTTS